MVDSKTAQTFISEKIYKIWIWEVKLKKVQKEKSSKTSRFRNFKWGLEFESPIWYPNSKCLNSFKGARLDSKILT